MNFCSRSIVDTFFGLHSLAMARLMIDTREIDIKSDEEDRKPEWETTQAPAGAEWWKGTSRFMNGDVLGAVSGVCKYTYLFYAFHGILS